MIKKLSEIPWTRQAQFLFKSIAAGILIAMAGGIYLNCPNNYVGAFLFSIGLLGVLILEANLFTGKVGYISCWRDTWKAGLILLFNFGIAMLIGMAYKGIMANSGIYPDTAAVARFGIHGPFGVESARFNKTWYRIFFDGFSCGVFIYLAVELFKKTKNILLVILCVMGFILTGAEHSIADAFYLGASSFENTADAWKAFGYLGLIILGNAAGSLAIRGLQAGMEKLPVNPRKTK